MTADSRDQRVLIVEDEPMLAYALEELVVEAGFQIAGVVGTLRAALAMIERDVCDVAILDANLKGVSAAPAATALIARRVPFVVLSGYSRDQQPAAFNGAVHLQKPCRSEHLIQALRSLLPVQSTASD
jgi:CheY-like chemotaxis protein